MSDQSSIIPLAIPLAMSGTDSGGTDWHGTAVAMLPRGVHMSYLVAVAAGPPQWFAQEHVQLAAVKPPS